MQLLEHRNAVVYGAAGTIGRAVSKGFAAQGARVWLAGRTRATLEEVAADIRAILNYVVQYQLLDRSFAALADPTRRAPWR